MTTQINQLTELTSTSDGDLLLIRENATGVDKKMQASNLRAKATTKDDVGLGDVDNVSAANLRDRSTHTGTQPLSTISDAGNMGLQNKESVNIDGGTIDGTAVNATNLAYSGTLTGGTGVVNLGSGQVVKDATGNVGIGTVSPGARLQNSGTTILGEGAWPTASIAISNSRTGVLSNTEAVQSFLVGTTQNAVEANRGGGVLLGSRATTGVSNFGGVRIDGLKESATEGDFRHYFNFSVSGQFGGFNDVMRIDSSGNVGIGTTATNSEKLNLDGNIFINQNRFFSKSMPFLAVSTAHRLLTSSGFNDNRNTGGMFELTVTAQSTGCSRVKTFIWQAGVFQTSRFSRLDETNSFGLAQSSGARNVDFTVSNSFDGNDAILEITPTTSGSFAASSANISVIAKSIGGRLGFTSGLSHPLT